MTCFLKTMEWPATAGTLLPVADQSAAHLVPKADFLGLPGADAAQLQLNGAAGDTAVATLG
jgi:hypothetical protein